MAEVTRRRLRPREEEEEDVRSCDKGKEGEARRKVRGKDEEGGKRTARRKEEDEEVVKRAARRRDEDDAKISGRGKEEESRGGISNEEINGGRGKEEESRGGRGKEEESRGGRGKDEESRGGTRKEEEGRGSRRVKCAEKEMETAGLHPERDLNILGGATCEGAQLRPTDFELPFDLGDATKQEEPMETDVNAKKTETEADAKAEPMEVEEEKAEKWEKGERILCFHGPLIYEAKIQEVEVANNIPKYFIHYKGWNKNWDEWVPEARMLKFNEGNVENQKGLVRAHEAKEASRKRREHVFAVPQAPSPLPKDKGRRKNGLKPKRREGREGDFVLQGGKEVSLKAPDATVETEEVFKAKVEIKIKMPEELKTYIVDDWQQVCRQRRLCVLPARSTADQLLAEYARAKTANKAEKMKNNKEKAILEVTAGIREYFNAMLPSHLLYRQERAQYEAMVKQAPGLVPCKVYGPVHLLRLFTKLGEMLAYTPLCERSIQLLLYYLHDLLAYIKRNAGVIFSLADYQEAQ